MQRDIFRIIHPSADVVVLVAMIEIFDTDEDMKAAKKLTVDTILESAEAVWMDLQLPVQIFADMGISNEIKDGFASKYGCQEWFFP